MENRKYRRNENECFDADRCIRGKGAQGSSGVRGGDVAACRIGAGAGFLMRCRRPQELRAYPVSKRGWMRFAGHAGPPAGPGSGRQGFVLKGVLVVLMRFSRCLAAPKIRSVPLLEFVKTRPYN
ncbi:hypothetical protein [Burkholderia pyrrocinia]|uniref:hypothetical protein n=1 Tax=Burkholderia pyrrocinia TaxID=60550 RepID=UPI002AB320CD|nr:hypothetical protein [Burkholderia pyrrocinia]